MSAQSAAAPTPPAPAASTSSHTESTPTEPGESDSSTPSVREEPAEQLASSLRAHAQRLVRAHTKLRSFKENCLTFIDPIQLIAKIRTEFEQTILTILTLNVIYTYYLDHTLFVLAIRVSQVVRVRNLIHSL